MDNLFKPVIFIGKPESVELFKLLNSDDIIKKDFLPSMLVELALNKFPSLNKNDSEEVEKQVDRLKLEDENRCHGNWIYFPWRRELIRILGKSDFIFLRTCRNHFKVLQHEEELLSKKSIGIVGLSVGYSVLMAISLERIVEKIRIADFDLIELSNLNRIYQPLCNLGLNKSVSAARAVYELDPYMDIEIFSEGLSNEPNSIKNFISGVDGSNLDLIVDECDSGRIKLELRKAARELRIPLLMETSDRSVLDIERYDLDGNYPLLHGMLEPYTSDIDFSEEKSREILFSSIDFSKVSKRGLESMNEIGKQIRTWPQLGTDVLCGGVSVAIAVKKILLGSPLQSQRIFLDLESRIH